MAGDDKPPRTQAQRIFDRFGGVPRLHAAMVNAGRPRDPSNIYRWDYPRSKGGCGGVIPNRAWDDVLAAARLEGIHIPSEDFDKRTF